MIPIGLYGTNGHQIQQQLVNHPRARLAAVAEVPEEQLPSALRADPELRRYDSLKAMLSDSRVRLVSLCSPRRSDQARDAIQCLEAGRHVYAEKPCALNEPDLDRVMQVARRQRLEFHEMAGTAFDQPYRAMGEIVRRGRIGQVVQITVQKSYPYFDGRPQDEAVDGGLIGQCAIHALRLVEQVAGQRIAWLEAAHTSLGNPAPGQLRMAASLLMGLENGGLASASANYLNPRGTGVWGYESLRLFGTQGLVEAQAAAGGFRTRLVIGDDDCGPVECSAAGVDFFECLLSRLLDDEVMPLTLEQELRPTRLAIRAREAAQNREQTRGSAPPISP